MGDSVALCSNILEPDARRQHRTACVRLLPVPAHVGGSWPAAVSAPANALCRSLANQLGFAMLLCYLQAADEMQGLPQPEVDLHQQRYVRYRSWQEGVYCMGPWVAVRADVSFKEYDTGWPALQRKDAAS